MAEERITARELLHGNAWIEASRIQRTLEVLAALEAPMVQPPTAPRAEASLTDEPRAG